MPFPNKPFNIWDKDDLEYLLTDPPAVENARRDFKADCKLLADDKKEREKARKDTLKDISAMANGAGGSLLIGVRQSGKKGSPPFAAKIEGIKDEPEQLKQAIEGLVNAPHLDVRPGPLEYYPIQDKYGQTVLIVDVPANTYSLSMVIYKNLNQFWVRRGTDNCLMTTDEIEYRFGQFGKIHDAASDELSRIRSDLQKTNISPMVWFAGVPISRSRDHIPVRIQMIRELLRCSSYFSKYPKRHDPSSFTPYKYEGELTPCLKGVGILREWRDEAVLDIRRDGTLVFAFGLRLHEPSVARAVDSKSCEAISLRCIYEPLSSALHLFSDIQQRFEMAKISVVQGGLIGVENIFLDFTNFFDPMRAPKFPEGEIVLDGKLLDEHWDPTSVFGAWALQLANAVGREQQLPCSPWTNNPKKQVL